MNQHMGLLDTTAGLGMGQRPKPTVVRTLIGRCLGLLAQRSVQRSTDVVNTNSAVWRKQLRCIEERLR